MARGVEGVAEGGGGAVEEALEIDDVVQAVGDRWTQAIWWECEGEIVVEVEEGEGQLSMGACWYERSNMLWYGLIQALTLHCESSKGREHDGRALPHTLRVGEVKLTIRLQSSRCGSQSCRALHVSPSKDNEMLTVWQNPDTAAPGL